MLVNTKHVIETERLKLVCCDLEILNALFSGDEALGKYLNINIPAKWTKFGEPAFSLTHDKISNQHIDTKWLSYLPLLKEENMLVGSCGFKGEPNDGLIEIGYEVAKDIAAKDWQQKSQKL